MHMHVLCHSKTTVCGLSQGHKDQKTNIDKYGITQQY